MRYFIFALLFIASCNILQSDNKFTATVHITYAGTENYTMFKVIESDSYDEPEINIHYGDYVEKHPEMEEIIENDTIRVRLEEYNSEFNTSRYRLLEILD